MNPGYGENPAVGLLKGGLHVVIAGHLPLNVQEGRDQLKAVADAVVDLPQEQGLLFRKRLELIAVGEHPGVSLAVIPFLPG